MRVRVWIDPHTPLIAGGLHRQDHGVMIWVEFQYERVYKICRKCGTIGHTSTHYPYLNPDIKRMIGEQMDVLQRRFGYSIGYDFQNILFTSNIRAFSNKGSRRTMGIESINRSQLHQETTEK